MSTKVNTIFFINNFELYLLEIVEVPMSLVPLLSIEQCEINGRLLLNVLAKKFDTKVPQKLHELTSYAFEKILRNGHNMTL